MNHHPHTEAAPDGAAETARETADLAALQVAALTEAANAVMITDAEGTVLWVNSAFERLTGYANAEIAGRSPRVLKSGKMPRAMYEEMWRTILAGKKWRGELVNRRKDGSLYDEEMTVTPLRNGAGRITHFVAIKLDIAERKRAQERLTVFSRALENTSEFIAMGDADAKITFANPAWLRALGYTAEEIVGRHFHSTLSPNNRAGLFEEIDAGTHAGGWRGECLQRRKDGSEFPVLLSTGSLKDSEGRVSGVFGIARDITERKRAEQEIVFKNTLLEAQTEATMDAILAVDDRNGIILSNQEFCRMWGLPPEMVRSGDDNQLLGLVIGRIAEPEKFRERVAYLYSHREEKAKDEIRLTDGRVLDRYSSPLIDAAGRYHGRIWYFREITERIQAEERLQLWSRVLDQSAEGIFVCDPQERILLVNKAFEQLTGYPAAEAVGRTPRILKSGRQDEAFYAQMWAAISGTGNWQGEMWNRRKNGELYVEWLSVSAVYDRNGAVTHYVGIFSDITTRKRNEEQMVHLAQHDALTDLPNRVLLMDRLHQLTKAAKRRKTKVAVAFIDLDRFKDVNDSLGHDAGDLLLQTAAQRLSAAVREEDTVARIGGDEFVVIFQGLRDARSAALLAEKLHSCLAAEPVALNGYDVTVTASIGVSLFPDDAGNAQDMIRNADAAMYQAKNAGRNAYQFYTSDLNQRALEMLSLENALRRAIERHEFALFYQPQFRVADDSVAGAEALVRWNHPEMGLVMPGRFIGLAEERGLIVPIGNWVIEEACRQAAEWRRAEMAMRIAVNVSAVQFRQRDFAEQLGAMVSGHGIPPAMLELELTESIIMRDAEATIEILERLHGMGFRLSIDDFGTGYSSLSYLRRFPIDKIKIDQSFVNDPSAGGIVTAIIALARSLKIQVIAEGVQTPEQLAMLREQGCDEVQGFLYSQALDAAEFEKMMRHRSELALP